MPHIKYGRVFTTRLTANVPQAINKINKGVDEEPEISLIYPIKAKIYGC